MSFVAQEAPQLHPLQPFESSNDHNTNPLSPKQHHVEPKFAHHLLKCTSPDRASHLLADRVQTARSGDILKPDLLWRAARSDIMHKIPPSRRDTNPSARPKKSDAFLRRFTHKIRTQTPPATRPPSLPNSLVAKGQREAALRERGLLPPLRDPDDVVTLTEPVVEKSDYKTPASQIKQEWEARNAMAQPTSRDTPVPNVQQIENSIGDYPSSENAPSTPSVKPIPPTPLDIAAKGDAPSSLSKDEASEAQPPAPIIAITPATPAPRKDGDRAPPIETALTATTENPSSPNSPPSGGFSPTKTTQRNSSISESDSGISASTLPTSVEDGVPQKPELVVQRKSGEHTRIPVILESPIEENESTTLEAKAPLSVLTEEPEKDATVATESRVQRRPRTATDGGAKTQRRRSLMMFFGKRDKPERSASEHTPAPEATKANPKGGLLRSVIGSISRSKRRNTVPTRSIAAVPSTKVPTVAPSKAQTVTPVRAQTVTPVKAADPGAPVSPTSPTSPTAPRTSFGSAAASRNALAPTMHNRGTITTKANALDDESQRVCEIHFLT